MNDTIAAISTPLGVGAISIVRLSGEESINIVNKIFKGKNLDNVPSHSINHGYIIDNGETIDEVLVSVMKSPKTFTMEDMVEINCHGGIAITNKILELILLNDARLAEPGEFTKRAFLNGKMDLIEAGAVMDIINSKTEKARIVAANQLSGKVSSMIKKLRANMSSIISNVEVNIDYPEYEDILVVTNDMIKKHVFELEIELSKILKEAENGKLIKEGIKTVIIGRPNVGKSSILNKLLDEEKAIVTDVAGTTRDIVEGSFILNGVLFNVLDTAGIRNTEDKVEKIGVEKSKSLILTADLIILVLNNNEELTKEDMELLELTKNQKRIIFVNKVDLVKRLFLDSSLNPIYGNTLSETGVDLLKKKIIEMFNLETFEKADLTYLSNSYQISIIKESLGIVDDVKLALKENVPIDMIEIDIRRIWEVLGKLTGENLEEELINDLFSKFCVGK